MKKMKVLLSFWAIVVFVTGMDQRYVSFDPTVVSIKVSIICLGTTAPDTLTIGENSSDDVDVNIVGVNSIALLETRIAQAVRSWATSKGFSVPANLVFQNTLKAS